MPLAKFLDSEVQPVDHEPFNQGYLEGWQAVRGADDHPLLIPPCPVLVGPAIYIGFSRGTRDARAMISEHQIS